MGFYQDAGTMKYGPLQPEFKAFLETMAAWYKEGLIDPDFGFMEQKTYDAKLLGGQAGAGFMYLGSGVGGYTTRAREKDPNFTLLGVPYPTLKPGQRPLFGQRDTFYSMSTLSAAISGSNKRIEESMRLLDYGYGPEGHMLFNFGVEGLTYTMVNGYPKYTDLIMRNPEKLTIAQAMAQHFRANFYGPFVQDKRYVEQYFLLPEQQEAYKTWQQPSNEGLLPPVTPTQDESRRFAQVMAQVDPRYDEMFVRVISGAEPLASWDAFVAEIKLLGIDEAVQVQQAALDRYARRS